MSKRIGWNTSIVLPPELMMRIAQYCAEHKCTRAEALRALIERGLDCIE